VWTVRDDRLELLPVKAGLYGNRYVEIISGLSAGQEIAVLEGGLLKEGDAVTAIPAGTKQ
jgi:hypothetical protein